MRIISGAARGKQLATFKGGTIRPTPDRVREAVFSILTSRCGSLAGLTVLDLFAGTGAMALEALSRGASRAVLVDKDDQALALIAGNLKSCAMTGQAEVLRGAAPGVLDRLPPGRRFDLIFLDPPYGQGLVETTLQALGDRELLVPGGVVCAESGRHDQIPERIGKLRRYDLRRYGITAVHFFEHADREAPPA